MMIARPTATSAAAVTKTMATKAGPAFVAIVFVTAAAEVAVGLAIIISAYRRRSTVVAEEIDTLKG